MIERYTRPEMGQLWTQENKFKTWLQVEILVCEALAELGKIPQEAVNRIRERAKFDVKRIEEIEKEVRHDMIAFLTNVGEFVGEDARYLHLGLTSSDVIDTALGIQLKQASEILENDIQHLLEVIKSRALEHKDTLMIGRTHGIHAEPITFGLKMAVWYTEMKRNQERLRRAKEMVSCGKISGAVGTFANIDPFVEAYVCQKAGLTPAPVSTQIVQRDRHGEFVSVLALIASSLDKFATEIRGLQKTEIREVEEPFYEGQKGSSAMPHKRNPVSCEQISGLARVVRGYVVAALEDIPLWHERDISHSSVERIILPDSTILLDYMLTHFTRILRDLRVYPENMKKNLGLTRGLIFSESLLLLLTTKGLSRERAYKLVQRNAMQVWDRGVEFKKLILEDPDIRTHLTEEEIEACFNLEHHLQRVDFIFQRVFG
ncbi:MAG TPA: adenylosuccinate lyase [Candidatus Limnocylindrales bacterium]|nr:adenylosuccinate lyase [Candidatus Limnocylindrales bacterium]